MRSVQRIHCPLPTIALNPLDATLMLTDQLSPLDATLTKNTGAGVLLVFQCSNASTRASDVSPFFSNPCALFCTRAKLNSFLFKHFRTLSPKTPGVGGAFVS
jgi:hypothetical protein